MRFTEIQIYLADNIMPQNPFHLSRVGSTNTGALSCSVWPFYPPLSSTWRAKVLLLATKWPRYSAVGTRLAPVLQPAEEQEL